MSLVPMGDIVGQRRTQSHLIDTVKRTLSLNRLLDVVQTTLISFGVMAVILGGSVFVVGAVNGHDWTKWRGGKRQDEPSAPTE